MESTDRPIKKRTPLVECLMLVESRKQARFVHWLLGLNNNQKMYNVISQLSGKYIERNHVFVGKDEMQPLRI